ncbi:MAG TPA: glycosyltransferase [Stellaceae bacterium]|jgi:spore maturation protein CgeB|nr:glycosyltransferase [Stellaceae bacterium]
MKLVVFGLVVSSSWGNGHAVLWRALIRGLGRQGHRTTFFERDVPYYAENRDLTELEGGRLILYRDWQDVAGEAGRELADADAAIVTSYCPDALIAGALVCGGKTVSVFYDLDSPVTLARLAAGEAVDYIGREGVAPYDLVLSYAGGGALAALRDELGAHRVAPLYGCVDPDFYPPVAPPAGARHALSYLGTYAADRQRQLAELFLEPAARRPDSTFLIGGAQYPPDFCWRPNLFFDRHVAPADHPRFYAAARATLNITRSAMAACGWCPSGRLFEAAACGTPILSDWWDGIDDFFVPCREFIAVRSADDVLAALGLGDRELGRIGAAAREWALAEHTAERRAAELVRLLETADAPSSAT